MNLSITSNMRDLKLCHHVKRVLFGSSTLKLDLSVQLSGECSEIQLKIKLNQMDQTLMVIKEIFKNSIVEK